MKKIVLDAGALVAPIPAVVVSCGNGDETNLITIGWTGILNTKPPMTYIAVRPGRHSYGLIRKNGEFVINLTTADMAKGVDICGMYTGKKRDKAKMAGFTLESSEMVECPSVKESPLSLECRVERIMPLGSHHVFVARILCVKAREDLIDKNGRLCLEKADLCAYSHGEYFSLGKSLGKFGFSAVKKKKGTPKKKIGK